MNQTRTELIGNLRGRLCIFILILADTLALLSSIVVAHILRFDHMSWWSNYRAHLYDHTLSLPLVIGFYIVILAAFRLYRCAWRFASLEMIWSVISANSIGLFGLIIIQTILDDSAFSWPILVIMWASSIMLVGGTRIFLRVLSITQQSGWRSIRWDGKRPDHKRAVIIGAGNSGFRVLRAVKEDPDLFYDVVGFLDDDPLKRGTYIGNVRVLGPLNMVKKLAADKAVDEIIVAVQEVSKNGVRKCVMECSKLKVPVKVIPHMRDVLNDTATARLTDFSVEDLLRRSPVDSSIAEIDSYLTNRRVLVTGAGGSIGSELCRQIATHNPASLVLFGHGENSVHGIHQELIRKYPAIADRIHCVIASTANQARVNQVFKYYNPQVVFHAAAHKHVPIMESNEQEAVNNNVLGTYHIAAACGEHKVERTVLVSTDKAADPCCIMGATKWLCEEVFRGAAVMWKNTCFVTVRFGNVLGSRGSVVPLFHQQIKRGGPVLVTHPEMTRYFMTIPEAVMLVLEAGAVGTSGQLYLLDMGEPVKILDLAYDMIRLCGLEPGVDIAIEITGIRPGEKLHENLISESESIGKTPWPGLTIVQRPDYFESNQLMNAIQALQHAVNHGGDAKVRRVLNGLLPGQCRVQDAVPHPSNHTEVRQNI